MAYPSFAKTWQFNVNQTFTAATSAQIQGQILIKAIKDSLIGFGSTPWTVRYSCNAGATGGTNYGAAGAAGDGVDRWTIANATLTQAAGVITVPLDINFAASGSRHSWIVLRQTGIATNYEICIDCNNASSTNLSFVYSPSAGFTGGSATARPTATDELAIISSANWWSATNTTHQLHVMQSSDGQCTRVQMWRGGTNQELFWLMDKVQNPVTGWTNPSVTMALQSNAAISTAFATIAANGVTKHYGAGGTPAFSGSFTFEAWAGSAPLVTATGIGTAVNTFDSQWPVMPIGLAAVGTGNAGRIGNVYDLWYKPTGISDADTFPNNAAARSYAALGGLVFPWKGDATVPLIA